MKEWRSQVDEPSEFAITVTFGADWFQA